MVLEWQAVHGIRNWRGAAIGGFVIPVVTLAAIGFGLGAVVPHGAVGDSSYLRFVAPAVLATAAFQYAVAESTEPVMAGFKWQRTYEGVAVTPVTPPQMVIGQLLWTAVQIAVSGALVAMVMVLCDAMDPLPALLALLFSTVGASAFAAPVMAFSAMVRDGSAFTALNRMIVLPMTLVAGTYFPVSQLPAAARGLAMATPLWHTVELCRAGVTGHFSADSVVVHLAVLALWAAVGLAVTIRLFRRRLTS
ncbi:ABC transporter permease [Streptomyces sp. NPDC057654]|uniref:ABC transporter permease n=1 Tax=Streptomyces sp. NPDC057654 TaxID=3346196 RepID=UPI0036C69EC2